jgi:hypothetical protein
MIKRPRASGKPLGETQAHNQEIPYGCPLYLAVCYWRILQLEVVVLVIRRSPFSGKTHEMDLPITEKQVADYRSGTLLQNAFPNLSADEREFYKTGITAEEWKATFGE